MTPVEKPSEFRTVIGIRRQYSPAPEIEHLVEGFRDECTSIPGIGINDKLAPGLVENGFRNRPADPENGALNRGPLGITQKITASVLNGFERAPPISP
jgi:hypothetical protein